ncbi:MAG: iron-sulfur cluster assembly scaffold protein [Planctomycetales bacterium]|jgi:nitrogen fixation NifU-like protein
MDENPILEHFESPFHRGKAPSGTHERSLRNPACGDELTLRLRVHDGQVGEAWFTAAGCMVSQAATSMLCEYVEGRTLESLAEFQAVDMLALIGVPLTPRRQQCGLLPFRALKELIYLLEPVE